MMKKLLGLALAALACSPALADLGVKNGSGADITIFDYVIAGKHYGVHVNVDSSGNPIGVAGNPLIVGFASPPTMTIGNTSIAMTNAALGAPADPRCTATDGTPEGLVCLSKQLNYLIALMTTNLGSPFQSGGSIGNSSFGAKVQDAAGTALFTSSNPGFMTETTLEASIGTTTASSNCAVDATASNAIAALKCVIGKVNTIANAVGAPGAAAPGSAMSMEGTGPSGNGRAISTSTSGGLLPGQAAPASTRTTLTASTITTIDGARPGRLLATVQVDGSPSAAIYLCFNGQSTTCSATVYDTKIASGAADAAIYTAPFGFTGIAYAFSTGTPTVNVSSWVAQ